MRIKSFVLLCLSCLITLTSAGQNLRLPIYNYTNKIYGRNHDATNHCIITDYRNFVYAGNANGIMEYDGSRWRFIPVRQGAYVISMALAPDGTLYVGSQQEFGLLGISPAGAIRYLSLSDSLPGADRNFSNVWATHATEEFVAFQSEECLFIYSKGSLRAIYPETSFHTSFLLDSELYVRERETGLKVLREEGFVPVRDGQLFANLGIFGMFPLEGKKILIATREKGFYVFDPLRGIVRMPTPQDDFLINAGIIGGMSLTDGNIALNTLHNGVIVCSPTGEIRTVINRNAGLNVNDVKKIWQDLDHNIWCALDNGISRIGYESPVSYYQEAAGLEGSAYTMIRHEGRLFVGTTSGLFAESPDKGNDKAIRFEAWPGIRDQVWNLVSVDNSLLVGTGYGLWIIRNGTTRKLSNINAFRLEYLEKHNMLLVGGTGGLTAFNAARNWIQVKQFEDINEDIKDIAVNRSSLYEETEVWLGTSLQGAIKVLIRPDLSHRTTKYYGMADGLPEDWVLPMTHRDTLIFGTSLGAFRFIDEVTMREALPDSLKDKPEYYRGYFENSNVYGNLINQPLRYLAEEGKRTWMILGNEIACIHHHDPSLTPNPGYPPGKIITRPFRGIDLGKLNSVYPDDESIIWFVAGEGLARYDMRKDIKTDRPVYPAVRNVSITGDSSVYYGYYKIPGDLSADDPGAPFRQPEGMIYTLDHAHNDIVFHFTAPYYDKEDYNRFSWMLEGYQETWTAWSLSRVSMYTNLREGRYKFRLRMQDVYGDISETTTYSFIVKPPWSRTPLAYFGYAVIMAAFVYLMVRLGQRRLRKKNERLEAIVHERTEEIRQQNIKLAAQKKEITDSIQYAERIQRAILPHTDRIEGQVEDYFILFRPKDIVSGDFYWVAENGHKIIVTAVDCTGHGVPGAFMSMLGISFLNKIILENNTLKADQILNDLRENVISSLKQTGQEGEARDGMDMALVVIDLKKMTMEFAGANNPLYMVREDELMETKADRMPIAFHPRAKKFSNHLIQLEKGDAIYLFSDGYADQFGGPSGKKFKYKTFKDLLQSNRGKSMKEIEKILIDELDAWIAPHGPSGEAYEQVDDILVIGLRI